MIRWLNRDHKNDRPAVQLRGSGRANGRCILNCSINLKPKEIDPIVPSALEQARPVSRMKALAIPDIPPRDDATLVSQTLEGDKEAYRVLVERYQNRLLMMVTDILNNREDAEDVVQESFVKAFLSLRNFKGQSSFYTWLYRIARNMAIDVRRKRGRRGGHHVEYKEAVGVNRIATDDGDVTRAISGAAEHLQNVEGPHAALVRKEAGHRLQQVLGELSEEHRAVVMLREVDGLNYDEIAHAVGVPRGTVMSRLHYARKALQKALSEFVQPTGSRIEDNEGEAQSASTTTATRSSIR